MFNNDENLALLAACAVGAAFFLRARAQNGSLLQQADAYADAQQEIGHDNFRTSGKAQRLRVEQTPLAFLQSRQLPQQLPRIAGRLMQVPAAARELERVLGDDEGSTMPNLTYNEERRAYLQNAQTSALVPHTHVPNWAPFKMNSNALWTGVGWTRYASPPLYNRDKQESSAGI